MTQKQKILSTILLVAIAASCFVFIPPNRTQTTTLTTTDPSGTQRTEQLVTEVSSVAKLVEWLGISALVLALWIWRRDLGITKLGPTGGPEVVTQQEGGEPAKPPDESGPSPSPDLGAVQSELADAEAKQGLEHIVQMFQRSHSVNVSSVTQELGITTKIAKTYLYLLTKSGHLRADGFPKHTRYTPAQSIENQILDAAAEDLSRTYGILSERRYVRIKRMYEVDALLESADTTFVVEAKVLRKPDIVTRLDTWVPRILTVAREFPSERVACVIAVGLLEDVNAMEVREQVAGITFDSSDIPVRLMIFPENEIPE